MTYLATCSMGASAGGGTPSLQVSSSAGLPQSFGVGGLKQNLLVAFTANRAQVLIVVEPHDLDTWFFYWVDIRTIS